MTFGAARMDVVKTDALATKSGRSDRSATDKSTASFGGALAEAQGRGTKPRTRGDAPDDKSGQASTSGDPQQAVKTLASDGTPRTATTTVAAHFPAAIISALEGAAAAPDAGGPLAASIDTAPADGAKPAPATSGASVPDGTDDAMLDQILQQDPTKRSDETASTETQGPAASLDFLSMLLVGANPKVATPPSGSGDSAAALSAAVPQSVDPRRVISPENTDPQTPTSTQAKTSVANVGVETHLAVAASSADRNETTGQEPNPRDGQQEPRTQVVDTKAAKETPAVVSGPTDTLPGRHASEASAPAIIVAMPGAPPVRSIAGAIVEMAGRAAPTAAADPMPAASPAPIARTLTLQLSPADLGTVDIRMHMSDGALDVALSISDANTLGLVSRERDALASALHDSTYTLHTLVIQDGGVSQPSGGHHDTSGGTSGGDPRPDRSGSDADPGQRGGGGRGQGGASSQGPGADRRDRPVASPADRRGSLFI